MKDYINEYFRQASEIEKLRAQNKELERSATLLSTFANELNQILKDKNSTAYAPAVKLVKGLSYVHIGDYNKIWISEFEGYDPNKIYRAHLSRKQRRHRHRKRWQASSLLAK
ncbi:hypothetical protein VB002_10200 [Campylobacter concisus]